MIKSKVPQKRNIRNLMTKNITIFPALKSSEYPVYLESPLEADFCYYLEFEDDVTSYQAQPLGFCYWDKDNEAHIYTPDFEVIFVNGLSCYYEIKHQADLNRIPNFELWFSDVRKAAKNNNKELRLVTDVLIRRKFRYENLCLLFKYSKYELDKQYVSYVKSSLCNKSMLIVDLIRNDFMNADFQQIYRLLWDKVLTTDIDSRILSKYQSVSLNSGQIK